MDAEDEVVAVEGVAPNGDTWALRYRPDGFGARHYMAFFVNGGLDEEGAGWDIPGTTEIGFAGGFKRGQGNRYVYGLTTSRIAIVRAESHDERDRSETRTIAFPAATTDDGSPLRTFVLVRPPVEDVTAIVGLDSNGQVVQRIPLPGTGTPLTERPGWTPDRLLESVRRVLASAFFHARHLVDRVDLVDEDIVVVFRGLLDDDVSYGVRFSLARAPLGPSTGEACDTAEQWATEVAIELDEAIGTREIDRAEQRVEQEGVVLLRWWPGDDWSR